MSTESRMTRAEEVAAYRKRRQENSAYNGTYLRLGVDEIQKDPDYVYRWTNDDKGKIHSRTVLGAYEFVENKELADNSKNLNESDNRIRREVGKSSSGAPLYAYLCRKRKDFYDVDQELKTEGVIERRRSMVRNQTDGEGGLAADAAHAYIPREVRSAIQTSESTENVLRVRRSRKLKLHD
jgi:hypothetical protein